MKKIIMTLAVVLCCAMTTVVNAQNTQELALKEVEKKAKLADKNLTNGKMQYEAAMACISDALGEKKDLDRALTYANRAFKISQEHPAPQDTLKGLSCYALALIYMKKQSMDNSFDFMEMAMDGFQEELGRYDPVTNGTKLLYGYSMLMKNPYRAFPKIQEAFVDNALSPQNKRIDNIMQAGIVLELALEMLIAEHTKHFHHALPRIFVDGKSYFVVQTKDWNMERPLVGWMAPSMMRSEAEETDYEESPIIVCDENFQFKVVPEEEREKYSLNFSFIHRLLNPRHLDFKDYSSGILFLNNPAEFDRLLNKFREFKAANK